MMSAIANISNSEKLDVDFDAWKLIEHDDTAIIRINMKAGHSVAAHVNEKDVVFYVLSGEGELKIDEQSFLPKVGDSILVGKGKIRSWTVIGDTALELLVVKYL